VRDASRTWDVLMLNARRQAEGYARVLPQVEPVLAALVRIGGLVHSTDGGHSFLPRRAA
jgi:hypothetical protein